MKKFAAGLLTALCATALATAQPTDEWTNLSSQDNTQQSGWADTQPANQAEPSFNAQAPIETQTVETVAEPQQTSTVQTNISATNANVSNVTNVTTVTNITNVNTSNSDNSNDPMPIDEQPAPAVKQVPISVGIRGAFIYGNMWGFKDLKSDGLEPPTGIGGEFGIAARFIMVEGLQFSPEIMFRIFNLSHEEDEIERCYKQMFLDFAFYIRGVFGGGFFLEFAPQISINTSAEYTYDGTTNNFERIEQSAAEFGLNVGVGYYVMNNLSLNFRWYLGLTEVFPDVKYEGEMNSIKEEKSKNNVSWATINLKGAHTMMFKFGVTYWFL